MGQDSSNILPLVFATKLDDYSTANMTYVGVAQVGSLTSDAVWQIKRLDETTGLVIKWAAESLYDQVWDDRTYLTYS